MLKPYLNIYGKVLFALFFSLAVISCDNADNTAREAPEPPSNIGKLEITVNNMVGTRDLDIGQRYVNANQDSFAITQLQYYLSNMELVRSPNNVAKVPSSYMLFSNTSTLDDRVKILDSVPSGTYRGIRLAVGIDSAHNGFNNGEGDLSPTSSTLWSWNTGYKFVVVEGNYLNAGTQQGLQFHVGNNVNYRILEFDFDVLNMPDLVVRNDQTSKLRFEFDVFELFSSVNKLNFKLDNSAAGITPTTTTTKLADNYAENTLQLTQVIN